MAHQPKTPPMPFNKKLVLNQYMLSLFDVNDFYKLAANVNRPENEGLSEDNISRFHHALVNELGRDAVLDVDTLLVYDQNIVTHTNAIRGKRNTRLSWKYFQYLALLFTEIYLDRYMSERADLLAELNKYLNTFNLSVPAKEHLSAFTEDDLRRIAFWSATGSGKTLIMHMNIKQVLHYFSKAGRLREMNRILLITPNEGLSRQHLIEMQLSGIQAERLSKDTSTMMKGQVVEIIEITKLNEKDSEKRVAVDSFEQNNFVLIDEGHRGSSGDVWGEYRRRLAKKGFAIEYSATLGQAAVGNKDLATSYAKSILFDYSYRHFYGDGYGKDYRIFNLPEDDHNEMRELYLTACMLSFYQQKMLFNDAESEVGRYNIENPLCVFVGSSVSAVRTEKKRKVSDVIDILLFLARFTVSANKANVIDRIEQIKNGSAPLVDANGEQVFANVFPFLVSYKTTAQQIYDDILGKVFNSSAEGLLHLEELKGADGEIALRLGTNEPFGVINVGDASELCKLCKEHDEFVVSSRNFSGSLFHSINDQDSDLHMLIGSKRFTEGWNSWRVSTMGLMNVGKSEGSQVIQLFGRGVRLKGLGFSLKRHSVIDGVTFNEKLAALETLNIFGVQSHYMEQFKKYLENEDIPTPETFKKIIMPVKKQLGDKKLKTIKIKDGLEFKKDGGKPGLKFNPTHINKVILDEYPRVQSQSSAGVSVSSSTITKNSTNLPEECLLLLNYDDLFFDLQRLKKERGWFNLCISKHEIKSILSEKSWYELLIPESQLRFDDFSKVEFWQKIANRLIQKYCDQFYKASKSAWEAPHRKYEHLKENDSNFIDEYRVFVKKEQTQLINNIEAICQQIKTNLPEDDKIFGGNTAIFFDAHLYQPLLSLGSQDVRVKPVALNDGEKKFIKDLRSYHINHESVFFGKEIYLLRNMTRSKGVGFFEAGNFYPDFILWLIDGDTQKISFIDPKGIRNLTKQDFKLNFYKEIKKIETAMNDATVELNSFIISVSAYGDIKDNFNGWSEKDFENRNVLFQDTSNYIEKLFKKVMPK